MKWIVLFVLFGVAAPALAQHERAASAGRQKVEAAYRYQAKLADSTITVDEVIANWDAVAQDSDVRRDADALAIAYGSEGLLFLNKGAKYSADSLLGRSIPLFRLKKSKAYFLVAYAEVDRGLMKYGPAMRSYEEILMTMDSMPELWDIQFYRQSGYAPYAYAIDAALGIAKIGMANADYHRHAVELLTKAMDQHSQDALGLMALVGLHKLGAIKPERYKFKLDLLCSRKPELRKVSEKFEKEFGKR